MKHKFLLLLMLSSSIIWITATATETEPNNTRATANVLALNGSNDGAIGVTDDEDWWSVTTTGDGRLDVNLTVLNGLYLSCQILDNDGVIVLNSQYTNSNIIISKDGLAAGMGCNGGRR